MVERGGLENRCGRKSTEGSNPSSLRHFPSTKYATVATDGRTEPDAYPLFMLHPEPASFTLAMKDMAVSVLRAQAHVVSVSDLYAMNWNPVASAADFGSRQDADYLVYALEQRYNWANGSIAPDIQAEVDRLMAANVLILSFPLYWFSTPAIMKGWIDRVLLSGLCYGGKRFYDQVDFSARRLSSPVRLADANICSAAMPFMAKSIMLAPTVTRHTCLYWDGCTDPISWLSRTLFGPERTW